MEGGPPRGIRPNINSASDGTAQQDNSHEASLSLVQRQGEQSPEQEDPSELVSSRPLQGETPGPSDKGKGKAKATDNTEADASDRSSSKADGTTREKRVSSLRKKVSFILPSLTNRSPSPAPPVPSIPRTFQGGFYIQRAPRTPRAPRSNFSPPQEAEPAAPLITPIRRTGQSLSSELSPLGSGNSVTLNQASRPAGILRDRRPPPIRVLYNTTESSVFPPNRFYPVQDGPEIAPGSLDPFLTGVLASRARRVIEQSPLRQSTSAIYSQPPPGELGSLLAAHDRPDTEKKELKAGKTKGIKSLFKSSKTPERLGPSSKELDNNNQQGQAIVSPALTNTVSSKTRLSPQTPTTRAPFFSGNSFKNLYKRSPSSSEILLPTSSKPQSRIVATMDNNQENQEARVPAAAEEINEQASSSSSGSSSSFLTPMGPLPDDQVIDLPRRTSWMQHGVSLPHPNRSSQNATNYTDREYGRYFLGYNFLQDGVPDGVDSLLSIGGYGHRLRTFALNASNERFQHAQYYKPYEVEKWAEQQGELFWRVTDDLPRAFHGENFKKVVGFEEPLCKTVRSLQDLRSAWELSEPFDAAISYKLPPHSYPIKKFDFPENALSFEPHERYAAAETSKPRESKGKGKKVNERSIAREYPPQPAVEDTHKPEPFELSHEGGHIERSPQVPRERRVVPDVVDDLPAPDESQETDVHGITPSTNGSGIQRAIDRVHEAQVRDMMQRLNDPDWMSDDHQEQRDPNQTYETLDRNNVLRHNDLDWTFQDSDEASVNNNRQGQGDFNQAHEIPERDIVQRLNDIDWMFEDSDEASMGGSPQEQRELDRSHEIPERDIVQRLNDIDWMFEDSDEETVNSNRQRQQIPDIQEADNTMSSTNRIPSLPVLDGGFNARRSRDSQTGLIPLVLLLGGDFDTRSRDSQTGLIPLILASYAHLRQSSQSTRARLSSSASPLTENNPFVAEDNFNTEHQDNGQSNIPMSVSAQGDDNSTNPVSDNTNEQDESVVLGLRGGGLEESQIKRMISGVPSRFKKLISNLNVPGNKNGKAPVLDIVACNEGSIDHQIEETSGAFAMDKMSATPRKSNVFGDGQETSVSPESSHYKPPDAMILSHGSIVPTSGDGYAVARLCAETYTQPPRVNSSHGDIRRMIPLDLNKPLPVSPKVEESTDGKVPNSRAWIEKAFEVSAELEKRRQLGSPPIDQSDMAVIKKAAEDTAANAAKLASLEKRISELERTGGSA